MTRITDGEFLNQQYTISQLAKSAGIPTTTMRYYERIGLVEPEDRSHGNYRLYGEESLRKVSFIRSAQAIGFTLDDVKALLAAHDSTAASCREVQTLIEERLAEVGRRLKDLRHVQRVLKSSLEKCKETERVDCCHVIETLRETAK
jgi:DNA-binding transcriptional MerR regulator